MDKKVELISPAGNVEKLKYALAYGADAVYAGIPKFSLRVKDNNFNKANLTEAVEYIHSKGKKIYVTLNIYPHNRKLKSFENTLKWMGDLKPDAIILSDPGIILLARQICPQIPIHLSTQANSVNWASVKFWHQLGIGRVILSRELSIKEISEIRENVPDIELEAFVHGGICIAYSGRCLLSNYFNHRDPNQGTCMNSCRWAYKLYAENNTGKKKYFLEEKSRPDELLPIEEDDHGTYIMNAKDLCAINLIDKMIAAGINGLKIEGRTKSIYYLSVVTRAYRNALDKIANGKKIDKSLLNEIYSVANRGYTTSFLENMPDQDFINFDAGHSNNFSHIYCGAIQDINTNSGLMQIAVRNQIRKGDKMEIISPGGNQSFLVSEIYSLNGESLDIAHGGGEDVQIKINIPVNKYSMLRKAIQKQNITK